MIRQALTDCELNSVFHKLPKDVLCGKVKALFSAYGTGYDFLRFYIQPSAVIAVYYSSAVVCGMADEETVSFLKLNGYSDILMPDINGVCGQRLNIMSYEKYQEAADLLSINPPYREVYDILSDGFDISFDEWYTDTCHNIRHGISELYILNGKAAAVKQFTVDNISLISAVAVKNTHKQMGYGSRLIRAVSERLIKSSEVYIICEDSLIPFYEKNGYVLKGTCINIKKNMEGK